MTSGAASPSRADRRLARPLRSIGCRSTSEPARLCRWGRIWSGQRKSRPTRSNCASIRARTAISRCTKTRGDNYDYEKGAYATIPLALGRRKASTDDRRAARPVPGDVSDPHFPCGVRRRSSWGWNCAHRYSGSARQLLGQSDHGNAIVPSRMTGTKTRADNLGAGPISDASKKFTLLPGVAEYQPELPCCGPAD